jgi:hypothetical protein
VLGLSLNLPRIDTGPFVFRRRAAAQAQAAPPFDAWLPLVTPAYSWHWPHLHHIRLALDLVTSGTVDRLMLFVPPRHGKSAMVTVRYPVWRLERQPDLRVIVGA